MYNNLQITSPKNELWVSLHFNSRHSYEVSSLGRIRITKNNYCCIKIQRIGNHKHPIISIRHSPEKVKRYLVHRLVASAFIENPSRKRTVNHKNGIKHDNRSENLEWASDYEQAIHRHYVLKKQTTHIATKIAIEQNQIPVSKYSLSGDFIESFKSMKDAAKSVDKKSQRISLSCKNNTTAYGYRWSYTHISHNLISKINSPINNIKL